MVNVTAAHEVPSHRSPSPSRVPVTPANAPQEIQYPPVAGRLLDFLPEWLRVTDDALALDVVRRGYSIEFVSPPSFNGVRETRPPHDQADVLSAEVEALLLKHAIRPVPPHDRERGYYSTYFLVTKKDGGFRPILNLRWLNLSVRYRRFRMETLRTILAVVRPGVWMASIDLKDAYFHIPINKQDHCYLRFMFRGVVYEYVCLPFGLSSAPWLFTKMLLPVLAYLRRQGILIYAYLDDLLVLAASPEELRKAISTVLDLLQRLAFLYNVKKSECRSGRPRRPSSASAPARTSLHCKGSRASGTSPAPSRLLCVAPLERQLAPASRRGRRRSRCPVGAGKPALAGASW